MLVPTGKVHYVLSYRYDTMSSTATQSVTSDHRYFLYFHSCRCRIFIFSYGMGCIKFVICFYDVLKILHYLPYLSLPLLHFSFTISFDFRDLLISVACLCYLVITFKQSPRICQVSWHKILPIESLYLLDFFRRM